MLFDENLKKLDKPTSLTVQVKEYWIINIPYYGEYVYYGTQVEAGIEFDKKCKWENTVGTMHKADPENKQDREKVMKELKAVWEDRQAGIKDLPFMSSKGWTG